jgi:hypothetical protein
VLVDEVDVAAVSPLERSHVLSALRRVESWVAAKRCEVLLGLGRDFDGWPGSGTAADEVMAAERISARAAERQVRLARVAGGHPVLQEALTAGRLGVPHAHRLAAVLEDLDPVVAAAVAAAVCTDPDLPLLGVGQLGRRAERAAIVADPAAAQARRHAAAARSDVSMCPHPDGMAGLWLFGPAEEVAAAMSAVASAAAAEHRAASPDESTPIGVRRFRTAIDWLTTPACPPNARPRPRAAARRATPRRAAARRAVTTRPTTTRPTTTRPITTLLITTRVITTLPAGLVVPATLLAGVGRPGWCCT